jgi:hypothetical protein
LALIALADLLTKRKVQGVLSHNEVLEMYWDVVDRSFTWRNFTLEEQALVLRAARSNNELCAEKLSAAAAELGRPLVPLRAALSVLRSLPRKPAL